MLILSHPLLSYPEVTIRTQLVGQSRNLWNVSGRGLGIFTFKRFWLGRSGGGGRAPLVLEGIALALGSDVAGGRAPLALEGTTLTHLFWGAPFEATHTGSRNDRAVALEPDVTFCL